MTINELDKLLDEALSPITEKKTNIEEDINQKSISKEETETKEKEEKPREITIRFINKVNK
ncbi:hypothetical protein WAF17_19245 [Bernardetia sp. ABR2-2B]|uniref:hypothetical protein n=1 Tax=Bernardetia sp. ABR2-2B TaxID=3127472 RepID=UPI0030CE8F48